jgi:hypothetical protein
MTSKTFRFALGSSISPSSGIWRLSIHENEVHVAVRTTNAEIQFTAYATGRWRIAIGDALSRWTRPKEFRPGWIRGPDLLIPYTTVPVRAPALDPSTTDPVCWLAPLEPGHQARFTLLFAGRRTEDSAWRPQDVSGTQSIAIFTLRSAGTLHLCRADEPLTIENGDVQTGLAPGGLLGQVGLNVTVSADRAGRPSLQESHMAFAPV